MVLNCSLQPQLRLQRHGFQSLQNRITIAIATASAAFILNLKP